MLNQRIITAIFIAIVFIAVLILSNPSFIFFLSAIIVMYAGWEWANLAGYRTFYAKLSYVSFMLGALILSGFLLGAHKPISLDLVAGQAILVYLIPWWGLAFLCIQSYPGSSFIWGSKFARGVIGFLVLVPTWVAIVILASLDNGKWLIFTVAAIVAISDISAYFIGLKFGKCKLCHNVSPNKTWEGFLGAVIINLFLIIFLGIFLESNLINWFTLFLLIMTTALSSALGDLLVSMMKRYRGIKDTGDILPGHGGILDRIDGHTAAFPIFTLIFIYTNFQF